ncbi:MAG TPA: hypothetical protein VKR32_15070 [Puia sp.]|nr:hypothetical protein [Puia sp.]
MSRRYLVLSITKSAMSLACLESCIDRQHPKEYPDLTAGKYLDERLHEIGLKK